MIISSWLFLIQNILNFIFKKGFWKEKTPGNVTAVIDSAEIVSCSKIIDVLQYKIMCHAQLERPSKFKCCKQNSYPLLFGGLFWPWLIDWLIDRWTKGTATIWIVSNCVNCGCLSFSETTVCQRKTATLYKLEIILQNFIENKKKIGGIMYGAKKYNLRHCNSSGQHFYRATLCISVVFAVCRCPSVCPSVTFVYCVTKMFLDYNFINTIKNFHHIWHMAL